MAWREVIREELTPDERCVELYGVAKEGLLQELKRERRQMRVASAARLGERTHQPARAVPGPTLQALLYPEFFRKYIEGDTHADS